MKLQASVIFFHHKSYRHYYLCQYLPLTSGNDTVSRSLLKFKRGIQPDRDNWLNRAAACLNELLPTLPADTIIIRALHHNETSATPITPNEDLTPITPLNPHIITRPSSLDLLGQALSAQSNFPYLPTLLQKHHPVTINQGLTRHQRESELRDIYYLNPTALNTLNRVAPNTLTPAIPPITNPADPASPTSTSAAHPTPRPSSILLLDDILTTGATILTILKTLHTSWPNCTITIFTLAKVA